MLPLMYLKELIMELLRKPVARGLMLAIFLLLGPSMVAYGLGQGWNMGQAMVAWGLYGVVLFILTVLLIKTDPEA